MISSRCSALVSMCCWRLPHWQMQPVTAASHRKTLVHAAHRKTSSHSLPTWQVQRKTKPFRLNLWQHEQEMWEDSKPSIFYIIDTHTSNWKPFIQNRFSQANTSYFPACDKGTLNQIHHGQIKKGKWLFVTHQVSFLFLWSQILLSSQYIITTKIKSFTVTQSSVFGLA